MACRFFIPEPPGKLFKVYRTCINNCFNWTLFVNRQMGPVMWHSDGNVYSHLPGSCVNILMGSQWIYPPGWMWYLIRFTFQLCNKLGTPRSYLAFMLPALVMNSSPLSPWEHREESSDGEVFSSDDQTWTGLISSDKLLQRHLLSTTF